VECAGAVIAAEKVAVVDAHIAQRGNCVACAEGLQCVRAGAHRTHPLALGYFSEPHAAEVKGARTTPVTHDQLPVEVADGAEVLAVEAGGRGLGGLGLGRSSGVVDYSYQQRRRGLGGCLVKLRVAVHVHQLGRQS
jgi:hypothetical protein